MNIGTRSVLFGAHQFLLHPLFVALAWWQLYGFPWDPRLWVAFFVHDLGYWGKPNMDGPEGEEHPFLGAKIMYALFDREGGNAASLAAMFLRDEAECLKEGHALRNEWVLADEADEEAKKRHDCYLATATQLDEFTRWYDFTLYHSRFLARKHQCDVSRLCVADKLAGCLEPDWLYLPRVILSGEIAEYMSVAAHKEGGKYRNEAISTDAGRRAWRRSVTAYLRRWVEEHKDVRADTWTPVATKSEAA